MIPFEIRIKIFYNLLNLDKLNYSNNNNPNINNPFYTGISINIRRNYIIEDTYSALMLNEHTINTEHTNNQSQTIIQPINLKDKIRIQFISESGTIEPGIDGGGLFREFFQLITLQSFHPTYGLFITTDAHLLTPNPASSIVNENHINIYYLFGKILGKALYEVCLLCLFVCLFVCLFDFIY